MYKSIQACRAIAATLVVLFHLGGAMAADKYFGIAEFSVPFSFGSAGVEFFFVLSGFIILTAHRKDIFKPEKLASYIKKRLIRIYPTYWIVFISIFVMALSSGALRNSVPHDVFLILKSLLLIPQDKQQAPVIIVAWTLQYEMFFYLLFASVIFNKWLSIVVGIVFTLLYLYAHYVGVSSFSFPLLFVVRDYILLFAMGMVVSVACMSEKMTVFKPVLFAYFGLVLFILVSMDTVMDINLLMKWKTILYGLASSLIVFGLVKAESKGIVFLKYNWVQLLGDSSYALYLIHFPLISILCKLSLSVHMNKFGLFGAITSYLAILAACLLSSVAFHLWIERPVTLYFRPFVKRHG